MTRLSHAELLDAVELHSAGFVAAVAAAAPDATVPSCPDWDVAELAWHLGWIWERFGLMAEGSWAELDQVKGYEFPDRPAPDELEPWLTGMRDGMLARLRAADAATPVWNWTGADQHVGWVVRRTAHETWMHRLDVEELLGTTPPIDPALAADGVDEFHLAYWMRGAKGALDGPVAVESSDTGDRWVWEKRVEDDALVPSDAPPVVTVRGVAEQLLRWVWRRPADLETIGDADVAAQLQAYCFQD